VSRVALNGSAVVVLAAMLAPPAGSYGRIDNPFPVIESLAPATILARESRMDVRITGKNFMSTSSVTFNNQSRPHSLLDDSHLIVRLQPQDVSEAGNYTVAVSNPAPGGGTVTAQLLVTKTNRSQ
jgi:hypothetical protein